MLHIYSAPLQRTLQINCFPNANMSRGFKIYIILVYNEDLFAMLKKISIDEFVKTKHSFLLENAANLTCVKRVVFSGKSYPEETISIDQNKLLLGVVIISPLRQNKALVNSRLIIPGNMERLKIGVNENGLFGMN